MKGEKKFNGSFADGDSAGELEARCSISSPFDGKESSRRVVQSLVNTSLDSLGKTPGDVDFFGLMLDSQQVNEDNIAHPSAVSIEFNWEGLCDLMLLRSVEQVEAVNSNVATNLVNSVEVTKVKTVTRQTCVDYAARTIKVSSTRVRIDKKLFFADHGQKVWSRKTPTYTSRTRQWR